MFIVLMQKIGKDNVESKLVYENLHGKIEKWSQILYLALVKVTPVIFIPNIILSFYLYFTTDLESDAFSLPFPMWYANHF